MYKFTTLLIACILTLSSVAAPAVQADTRPPAGTPATVSADALPTVQINGVVRSQVVVGNTVYVTGEFTKARPAGSPLGQNEVTRQHFLAYDIRTGVLNQTFVHNLNAQGWVVTASPDGKRVYVGGDFTSVNGQPANRIAAFDTVTGVRVASFTSGPTNGSVRALAANNYYVYVGGSFTQVSGGQTRTRLAAYSASGALSAWTPSADRPIAAMVISPDGKKVVVGGSFSKLNGITYYGLGALSMSSPGAALPWASQSSSFKLRFSDSKQASGVTSLSANASAIFLTAFHYMPEDPAGSFEGRAAISPVDGRLLWANDCHGDTYSAIPIGNVLYSAGHAHDCTRVGAFPENKNIRLLAESLTVNGTNKSIYQYGYSDLGGVPKTTQLNWYPYLQPGSYTGQNQAAWSITGNTQYLSAGGEFTKAGTMAQQGLVRYAISSVAPNKIGPQFAKPYSLLAGNASTADASGNLLLRITPAYDMDNGILTYRLYRDNGSAPIMTTTYDTRFWSTPYKYFTDTGLAPGSTHYYRLVATDPFGNTATAYSLVDDTHKGIGYTGGGWRSDQGARHSDYNSGIHYTTQNGDYYTYSFYGTGFVIVGHKNSSQGTFSVSVDGGAAVAASAQSATASHQQDLYTKTGLPFGLHKITVKKTGGSYMVLDGIRVIM